MNTLISRTDSIGDVVLTLPMAGSIKQAFPEAKGYFIGRSYTEPVVKLSRHVDRFINGDYFEKLSEREQGENLALVGAEWIFHVFPNRNIARAARNAGIPNRVGTAHRIYHWLTCNKWVRLSRKKSDLHEAQLNCMLLKPLGIQVPSLAILGTLGKLEVSPVVQKTIAELILPGKINVVLHPTSKGSAREWGLDNFSRLIDILPPEK